jgi:uroporphyrin-3 C-methyltransferase
VALLACLFLWQKLSGIQEILARQTFDATTMAQEAKGLAKEAAELSRDSAAHLSMMQTQLSEVSLQRTQLESLMQTLSRTRDENLLDELESSVRLAQQQAQLTGSVAPLLTALKLAQAKLSKLSQPRLSALERALTKDIERIKSFAMADTPSVLLSLDELVRMVDELPLANEMGARRNPTAVRAVANALDKTPRTSSELGAMSKAGNWVHDVSQSLTSELLAPLWSGLQSLVRISRIDEPQAVLLSPEQAYFVRENLKLRLLNAKLELLARQPKALSDDVSLVQKELNQYFDTHAKSTQSAMAQLVALQKDLKQLDLPHLDDTLAAFASAQMGR